MNAHLHPSRLTSVANVKLVKTIDPSFEIRTSKRIQNVHYPLESARPALNVNSDFDF